MSQGTYYAIIPHDQTKPIETRSYNKEEYEIDGNGDLMLSHLKKISNGSEYLVTPIRRAENAAQTTSDFGVYMYQAADGGVRENPPNIRATSVSMACGLHNKRFYGGKDESFIPLIYLENTCANIIVFFSINRCLGCSFVRRKPKA